MFASKVLAELNLGGCEELDRLCAAVLPGLVSSARPSVGAGEAHAGEAALVRCELQRSDRTLDRDRIHAALPASVGTPSSLQEA